MGKLTEHTLINFNGAHITVGNNVLHVSQTDQIKRIITLKKFEEDLFVS